MQTASIDAESMFQTSKPKMLTNDNGLKPSTVSAAFDDVERAHEHSAIVWRSNSSHGASQLIAEVARMAADYLAE